MKQGIYNAVNAFVVLLFSVACASKPPEPVPLEEQLAKIGFTIGQPVKRVINFQVSSWIDVDRKHVIMNFGASRYYLLTLRASCDGLSSATLITFSTTVGSLTDNDKLLVRNDSHHFSHCFIKTINELEKKGKTNS